MLVPVHVSAMSHTSDAGRQTVVAGSTVSGGHAVPTPSHVST
jgi:hypothetical protein